MPDVFNDANRELIIALAARFGVPAIYPSPVFAGRAASSPMVPISRNGSAKQQVHRSHPEGREPGRSADPTADEFELAINVKTAKALGLSVPQSSCCSPTR